MPATNPRVSAVIDEELASWLRCRAEARNLSVSTLVRQILSKFFEEQEERHWVAEGEERLATFDADEAVGHDEAWK